MESAEAFSKIPPWLPVILFLRACTAGPHSDVRSHVEWKFPLEIKNDLAILCAEFKPRQRKFEYEADFESYVRRKIPRPRPRGTCHATDHARHTPHSVQRGNLLYDHQND